MKEIRVIDENIGKEKAREWNCPYIECSARTGMVFLFYSNLFHLFYLFYSILFIILFIIIIEYCFCFWDFSIGNGKGCRRGEKEKEILLYLLI